MLRTRFFTNELSDSNLSSTTELSKHTWHEHIKSVVSEISHAAQTSMNNVGGLYVGNTGVAYMLWYISNYPPFAEHRAKYLALAQTICDKNVKKEKSVKTSDAVSFILGPAGTLTLGALLGRSGKNEDIVAEHAKSYRALAKTALKPDFLHCGSDELFVGRAGYVCGALTFQTKLGAKVVDDDTLNAICATMIESGRKYAKRHRLPSPLMYAYYDTQYLGAAHGLSSILQMIISCPSFLNSDPNAANDIKRSVDWMLSLQKPNGNFAPDMDEVRSPREDNEELVHWCHGAPGIVYLFAKAYKVWGEDCYLQACIKCGEITWQKGLLKKGPGICHGVAGSGYVFLLLFQLTNDEKWLRRAHEFAKFLLTPEFQSGAKTPDSPYSLFEGWAGTVCFLVDLQQPDRAEFPFFSIS